MNSKLIGALGVALLATSLHAQSVSTVISSGLNEPHALAVDTNNNVYITDGGMGNRILKYSSDKVLTVLAGRQGVTGASDGVGDAASFNDPHGIVYARGGLFVADYNNQLIRFVNVSSGAVTTIGGQYDPSGYGALVDGAPSVSQFSLPSGLAADSAGNIYVADFGNGAVRKIDLANNVTTIATGFGGSGFGGPNALALTDDTHILVADTFNNVIKRITIVPGVSTNVDVVAGTGVAGYKNSSSALSAQFSQPRGLLYVGGLTGTLVADTGNNYLRNLYYNTNSASLAVSSVTNGFSEPLGLAVDLDGNILVANSKAATIVSYALAVQPTPTITPSSGSYSNAVTVSFSTTLDANYPHTFHYTTDGSSVTPYSVSGTGITVNGTNSLAYVPVQVRSYAPDFLVSATASNSYTFFVATPVASPAGAVTNTAMSITLATDTTGAQLRYTTNGVEPTEASALYNNTPINLNGSCVVLVKGFKSGYTPSAVSSNTFSFSVPAPVISPAGISTNNSVLVTLSTETIGASLFWTIDRSVPSQTNGNLYTGPFTLENYGTLQVIGVMTNANYQISPISSAIFDLIVSTPVITPSGATNSVNTPVQLTCATPGAVIYYTFDGTYPSTNSASCISGATIAGFDGNLEAVAFRPGFISSSTAIAKFSLAVADPVITPNGATNDNPVTVTITNASNFGDLYYTLDGSEPTTNSIHYVGSFLLQTNGTLKVKGFAYGLASSAVVSAPFQLGVGALQVSPSGETTINSNTVTVATTTANAVILYTLDGSTPSLTNAATYKFTNSNPASPLTVSITTNTVLTALAAYQGFTPAASVANTYVIQVDTPVMSPTGGYFPSGSTVSFTVDRANASVYYTTDGTTPTTNSTLYSGPFLVDQVSFPGTDLRTIKAGAFAPNTLASDVVSGQSLATNSVGVPASVSGGSGATLVLPVVVNMASTQSIRSVQFRLEVTPTGNAPALVNDLEALSLSANDFVPVAGNSSDGYSAVVNSSTYRTTNSGVVTFGIEFHSIATNLLIKNFGVISNVKLKVPAAARNANVYNVKVLQVSGTSDASQGKLVLTNLPDVTLTVKSIAYLAGDISTGSWYNAGDFGDKNLDNADVNSVFQASLGVHTPYAGTDAYNAMDVYPETRAVIGDGLITYLDWQHVLRRSLRLETNNWVRFWTNGTLAHTNANGPTLGLRAETHLTASTAASSTVWLRQAMLVAGTLTNVEPGTTYSLPVSVKVLPGFSLAGLQFRAALTPQGGAPEAGVVQFTPTASVPAPMQYHLLPATNQASCAWSLDSFDAPLTGSNLLGYISFQVPATAQTGQSYALQLLCPGGASDLSTELTLETVSGSVWVRSAPASMPLHLVSDEWKANFFGSATNANADAMADPDGDGVPNWMEFLAGTNPTDASSHLKFSTVDWTGAASLGLRWDVVAGRVYVVESSPAVVGGAWTPVLTNTINDNALGADLKSGSARSQFYRLRLLQP